MFLNIRFLTDWQTLDSTLVSFIMFDSELSAVLKAEMDVLAWASPCLSWSMSRLETRLAVSGVTYTAPSASLRLRTSKLETDFYKFSLQTVNISSLKIARYILSIKLILI